MTRRIKFITKFLAAMAVLAVYSSCMDNPCVRGEGAKTSCNEDMFLHVMNATDEVVQIGNIKLQPSEKKELTYHYYHYLTGILVNYFGGDSVCVAKFLFNDSVTLEHKAFFADSNNRMYDVPSDFLPTEHNIFDEKSWETGYVDDSWVTWGVYTITDDDYQRALKQSAK
ncbi:MAG: hypothetical protein J6V33_09080 [Bacteroidales bacterium]|nr:hypothetical protein [Bacteroidales bacterium]